MTNHVARPHGLLCAGLLALGLVTACAKTPEAIRDLPELPAEFAKDLAPARTAPVLMTNPAMSATAAPPPATGSPLPHAPPRACTQVWQGYVTYPMTVCYPQHVNFEDLVLTQEAAAPSPRGIGSEVLPVRYFKLTSHARVLRGQPWFCSVRGGPWFCRVEGAQICDANPNIRSFTAQILGAPEAVVVTWVGALTDVPPPLQLAGIQSAGEFCVCCSGFACPDGTCKPSFDLCGTMPPA